MNITAGTLVTAIATTASDTGTVAHDGFGAMSAPMMPARMTTSVSPEPASICVIMSVVTAFKGYGSEVETERLGKFIVPLRA